MGTLRVRYLGPSPARIIPGVGRVQKDQEFSFPDGYGGKDPVFIREKFAASPSFELVEVKKAAKKAPAKPVGGEE